MRKALVAGVLGICFLTVLVGSPARAGSEDKLIRLLIKKGIITGQEYEAIKKEAEAPAGEPQPAPQEVADALRDEVRQELKRRDEESIAFTLKVEGEGRWRAHRDVGDKRSGSTSDLFLRRASVGLEARPLDFLTARLVLTSEWFGAQTTDQGQPVDEKVTIDEGTITLRSEEVPVYGVFGFRTQPFGAFFSRLVTDPMTQDAYEVKQVGATLGLTLKTWNLDLSATLYRGEEQMRHLFASGLFDAKSVVRSTDAGLRAETDDVTSFIVAASVAPFKDLVLAAAILSEPGDARRNMTATASAGYTLGRVTAEVEFAAALARERYVLQSSGERLGRSFEEKMVSFGLTYKLAKPLDVAARFEHLWDDGLARQAGIWSADNRVSLGVGYMLFEREETNVRLLGEYRFTSYRRGGTARDFATPEQSEAFVKLQVGYR
ncbi:MAG: hypothetical protein Q7W02_19450 [Candidatus Rokubacteria bacterium]|nr:hypothetical protein [Candidatus Rokubacteria bacterium]